MSDGRLPKTIAERVADLREIADAIDPKVSDMVFLDLNDQDTIRLAANVLERCAAIARVLETECEAVK